MKFTSFIGLFFLAYHLFPQSSGTLHVYLLPGQGSDGRIFKNLTFDPGIETTVIQYPVPEEKETMTGYAKKLLPQIDTMQPFVLIGVSLGGMLSVELSDYIRPEKIIIISSASCKEEVPELYSFFEKMPVYKYLPADFFSFSTAILQPLFEPDRRKEKATCVAMIHAKDPVFIKRQTGNIVTWQRTATENAGKNIVHIHGTKDHTLPYKNVTADYTIKNGSHMMTLTRADEISDIISRELAPLYSH